MTKSQNSPLLCVCHACFLRWCLCHMLDRRRSNAPPSEPRTTTWLIQRKRARATVWGPGFRFHHERVLGTRNRTPIVIRDVALAAIGPAWAHSNEGAGPQCTLGPNSSLLDTNPRVPWSCFVLTKSHTLCSGSSTHTRTQTRQEHKDTGVWTHSNA